MSRSRPFIFVTAVGTLLVFVNLLYLAEVQAAEWSGRFKNGSELSADRLSDLISEHETAVLSKPYITWESLHNIEEAAIREETSSIGRGILRNADLRKLNYTEIRLPGADLRGADLSGAVLAYIDFRGARLDSAILRRAHLNEVDFRGARLRSADMQDAVLIGVDLRGVRLYSVNLLGAQLLKVLLKQTDFEAADLASVIYEPRAGSLPNVQAMGRARNLHLMTYHEDRSGLVELNKAFRDAGLRAQERALTYALKRRDREIVRESGFFGMIESALMYILFEVTCAYSLTPGRPLLIMLALSIFCYFIYLGALRWGKQGLIWKVFPEEQVAAFNEDLSSVSLKAESCSRREIFLFPLLLTMLSAFRIGWRDLNVGTWLLRTMPFEYTLLPRDWVRTMAGVQSVLSVYLMALSILTYFGRIFE